MSRALFEAFVLANTGRDMDYHNRAKTTGMAFAWEAWQAAQASPPAAQPAQHVTFDAWWATLHPWQRTENRDGAELGWNAAATLSQPVQPTVKESLTVHSQPVQPVQPVQPIAWRRSDTSANVGWTYYDEEPRAYQIKEAEDVGDWYEPLYAASQTVQPAERVPLTIAQIEALTDAIPVDAMDVHGSWWHIRLARAIERAHGIGEDK